MVNKIRIAAVSYLNTLPFVYGITKSGLLEDYDLVLEVPSVCAQKFLKKEVDVALVPVALLPQIENYHLLPDFCISSNGKVKTVLLLSQVPLEKISKIHLDYHSLTSINLVKILSEHFWHIHPEWIKMNNDVCKYSSFESIVAIGDKTFSLSEKFQYRYDLSTEWKNFTGLPFVFAVWIVQDYLDNKICNILTKVLEWGVQHKKDAIINLFDFHQFPEVDINEYLEHNIDFSFDENKNIALKLFLDYMKKNR